MLQFAYLTTEELVDGMRRQGLFAEPIDDLHGVVELSLHPEQENPDHQSYAHGAVRQKARCVASALGWRITEMENSIRAGRVVFSAVQTLKPAPKL